MDSAHRWHDAARALTFEGRAFLNGHYRAAHSGATFDCFSPIDGQLLTPVSHCGEAEVDEAVAMARRAFEQGVWSALSPGRRKRVLLRFADLVEQHADELALLETLDMGKPIQDACQVDLPGVVRCLRWYAEALDKVYGEVAPTGPRALGLVTREPVGVVAAIVPWNFPLLMACWKFAPALALGNSVLLKPSERAPLSALRVAALAHEAGIPVGVFQVLPGLGATTGRALARHRGVDVLAFTGSTAVGKQLLVDAGQSNMKRVYNECGGKSAHLIFADCPDLEQAIEAAATAIFFNQGEVCTAGSRLLVEASLYERVLEGLVVQARHWQPADPRLESTRLGAMVDASQQQRVMAYLREATRQGARLCCGGEATAVVEGGSYLSPAILDRVDNSMSVVREEVFGPVLTVQPFADEAEALALANDSDYGLAAALWTADLNRAHRVARALRAGSVWVNCYDGGDMTVPFGGYKQSGNGRDKSLHALEKYSELKATWFELG